MAVAGQRVSFLQKCGPGQVTHVPAGSHIVRTHAGNTKKAQCFSFILFYGIYEIWWEMMEGIGGKAVGERDDQSTLYA